ncbi:MAG TPA: NAD(P)/FAD-dependent oxidoreductase [Chloroflexota bacterium]|nr:NAD(P)/FAD-dependent oxidoreductase [Chloroflexota bacterium]
MKVGIVGGGLTGLALAYYLSLEGVQATVFEEKSRSGGLLDAVEVDGAWIDRYYHCILSGDADLLALIDTLGLRDRVRFGETRQGFYSHRVIYAATSARDFLLFPPLTVVERFRLGLSMLLALRGKDWQELDGISVEDWLVGLGGRGTFEKLWKPLLRVKFDGDFQRLPATYIWARLQRMSTTRSSAGQKERTGYLVGSFKLLVDRLVERIEQMGSTLQVGRRVEQVVIADERVAGVRIAGEEIGLDSVIVTTPSTGLRALVPEPYRERLELPSDHAHLGVICALLLLDRGITPYYTLNVADERIPFTGVIETTNLISPDAVGGHHLVYLPKYLLPDSAYWQQSDMDLRVQYLGWLKEMFPTFREDWVDRLFVFRDPFVEPLNLIGRSHSSMPVATALPGLYLVNSSQIYPDLSNCQATVRHVVRAVPELLSGLFSDPSARLRSSVVM